MHTLPLMIVACAASALLVGNATAQAANAGADFNKKERAQVQKEREREDRAMQDHNKKFTQESERRAKENPNPHRDTKEYKKADAATQQKTDAAVNQQREFKQQYKDGKLTDTEKKAAGVK